MYFKLHLPIVCFLLFVGMQKPLSEEGISPDPDSLIERGRYLVNDVVVCGDCHTPRDDKGELVTTDWLQGAVLFFQPIQTVPGWTDVAPSIAGLSLLSDDEAVHLLETGKYLNGQSPAPPMPQYRFSHEDAVAVVTYLKTLKNDE